MSPDAFKMIDALIKSQLSPEFAHKEGGEARPIVVTISRDYGSGGREVAEMLAKELDVQLFDRELLKAVSERSGVDLHWLEQLDEKRHSVWDSWLLSVLSGENILEADYRHHLIKVIRGILHTGGVIVGHGAHIVLARQHVLHVRITASPDVCAKRIAHRKNISHKDALKRVNEVNKARSRFLWDIFRRRLNDPNAFDLTINTDRLDRSEDVVEIILYALLRYVKAPAETAI